MNKSLDELAARRQLRELQTQWQQTLDHDVATLDADVVTRLASARQRALQASVSARRTQHLRWLTPALAAMLLAGMWLPKVLRDGPTAEQSLSQPSIAQQANTQQSIAQQSIAQQQQAVPLQLELSDSRAWQEDSELLDELEFYTWLEVEAKHAS